MLTGYKIKGGEIAVDTSSKINQRASKHFKPVTATDYLTGHGQYCVLPMVVDDYYKSTENGFAAYGSSTYGGDPDVKLATGSYYFKFNVSESSTGKRLLLQYSTDTPSQQAITGMTIASYAMPEGRLPDAIKLWFFMCGGGGGGQFSASATGSSGGGGAASGLFSYTFTSDNFNFDTQCFNISIGSGGKGGGIDSSGGTITYATNGGQTVFYIGTFRNHRWGYNAIYSFFGGTAGSFTDYGRGGTVGTGSVQSIPSMNIRGSYYSASGGDGSHKVSSSSYLDGGPGIIRIYTNCDYSKPYNLSNPVIEIQGGPQAGDNFAGGGACAFYGATAGNPYMGADINATLGCGGGALGSGDYGDGGNGGNGACHIWVSGSNHYEVDDDITSCISVLFTLGLSIIVLPFDLDSDAMVEITYHKLASASVTETKSVAFWRVFSPVSQLTIEKAIIKSI